MHVPSILLTLTTVLLSLTRASPAAAATTTSSAATTLATTSFGLDPLSYVQSSGNELISSVYYDPSNAHTGTGYLSLSFPNTTDRRYLVLAYGFTLSAHTRYTSSYWAKVDKESECVGSIIIRKTSGNNERDLVKTIGVKYGKIEQKWTTGGGAEGQQGVVVISVTCTGNGTQQAYVDDFSLVEG